MLAREMAYRNCTICHAPLGEGRSDRLYCSNACKLKADRARNPERRSWAARKARKAARERATVAHVAADPPIMGAMPEDDPKWGGRMVVDAWPGGTGFVLGPDEKPQHSDHSAPDPERVYPVCSCGAPATPRLGMAPAAEVRERVAALEIAAMTGEPYVPLEGIAEGEPVRGDGAALVAMRGVG